MRLFLRSVALVLFLCGAPVFVLLGVGQMAVLIVSLSPDTPIPAGATEKFLRLYSTFALSGLLMGAGALLWAVAKTAYPPSANRPKEPSSPSP